MELWNPTSYMLFTGLLYNQRHSAALLFVEINLKNKHLLYNLLGPLVYLYTNVFFYYFKIGRLFNTLWKSISIFSKKINGIIHGSDVEKRLSKEKHTAQFV